MWQRGRREGARGRCSRGYPSSAGLRPSQSLHSGAQSCIIPYKDLNRRGGPAPSPRALGPTSFSEGR